MPKQQVGDINLYYEISGEGPPLLFIHGLGSSGRDWAFQVEHFAKNHQTIIFDVRGHGQSGKPPGPYSVALFARDCAGLLEALKLAPVHVVGISMGGMIAFQLAVDRPHLVKSLVIVNSAPELIPRGIGERLQVQQRFLIVHLLGMRKMGEVLAKRLFVKAGEQPIREIFADRWAENDKKSYLAAMRALIGWSVTSHLGEINIPTLIIAADQDYTPVSHKEEYVAKMPHAQLKVIEDSRHATPVEHPNEFNTTVEDFFNQLK